MMKRSPCLLLIAPFRPFTWKRAGFVAMAKTKGRATGRSGEVVMKRKEINSRKKLCLSKDQSALLEGSFKKHSTLNLKQKIALAKQLNLHPWQVGVWFQNILLTDGVKQTEMEWEFLKQCCENLTEENRQLQKEVHELRALKVSTPLYMQLPALYMQLPAATLTMYSSCEREGSLIHKR